MEPEAAVHALFDAFARRDVAAARAAVTEDFEFWPQGTSTLAGRSEPYRGRAGIDEYFADVAARWSELRLEPGRLRVAGGGVVVFGTVHGVADGLAMAVPVIWVFKLQDGLLRSCRAVATAAEALEAVR